MSALITKLGMKTMCRPKAMYCDVEGNRGMTAFAIIETSHIVLHTWDEVSPAVAQIDVYTCSDLTVEDVTGAAHAFGPSKIDYKYLDRPRHRHRRLHGHRGCDSHW